MASQLGLDQSTYCRIENGEITPSITQVQQIALLLGKEFEQLTDPFDSNKE